MVIVLDTNLLRGRADPEAASPLKTVLALAAEVGVQVAIPAPCLIELREGMRQDLSERLEGLSASIERLRSLQVQAEPPSIDEEEVIASYEARLGEFMKKHKIGAVPFPEHLPDVRTLFETAARKEPPFDATGNSYRDAVIALAVEEYAGKASEMVRFVTKDRRFRFRADSVRCVNPDEVLEELKAHLTAAEKSRRKSLHDGIVTALKARLPEIARRATVEVEFYLGSRPLWQELVSVDGFDAVDVEKVEVGAITEMAGDFSASIGGRLHYTVKVTGPSVTEMASPWAGSASVNYASYGPGKKVGYVAPAGGELSPYLYGGTIMGQSIEKASMSVALIVDSVATIDRGSVTDIRINSIREPQVVTGGSGGRAARP